ncbi:MAG: polysaccharide deacetylase family protein [Magnetospirillum sp.]|nr:polysaccharide deacetylase family protein [Magnetospirillum sp.]
MVISAAPRIRRSWKHWLKARLAAALGRGTGQGIPVITLHTLACEDADAPSPAAFEWLVTTMQAHYTLVPVGELAQACAAGLARPPASITFDDGFEDCWSLALPVLNRLGARASFFICPDFAGGRIDITRNFAHYRGRRPMSPDQIRDLDAAGMEIGAHTLSHPLLSDLSPAGQTEEIVGSKHRLEDWLGKSVPSFAIPFGGRRSFDRTTLSIAAEHFKVCCTTLVGTNAPAAITTPDCAILHRLDMTSQDDGRDMLSKLRGDWNIYHSFPRARPKRFAAPVSH